MSFPQMAVEAICPCFLCFGDASSADGAGENSAAEALIKFLSTRDLRMLVTNALMQGK